MKIGFNEAELAERRRFIGASEAPMICAGKWLELWLDKTGRKARKLALSEWDLALRYHMEPLLLDWREHQTGKPVTMRQRVYSFGSWPVLRATVDGRCEALQGPIDAKVLSPWVAKDEEALRAWATEHYATQVGHQMMCADDDNGALSVMRGLDVPVLITFVRDHFWENFYLDRCHEFWGYVERDQEPPGGPVAMPAAPEAEPITRVIDMTGSNEWGDFAAAWLEAKPAAAKLKEAEAGLKGLVEADVKTASGHGVIITQAKNGNKTIKEMKS